FRVVPVKIILSRIAPVLLIAPLFTGAALAQSPELERQFKETVVPFVDQYCVSCHGGATPAAKFDITVYPTLDSVIADHGHWSLVMARLEKGDMPPSAMPQPDPAVRREVAEWIKAVR